MVGVKLRSPKILDIQSQCQVPPQLRVANECGNSRFDTKFRRMPVVNILITLIGNGDTEFQSFIKKQLRFDSGINRRPANGRSLKIAPSGSMESSVLFSGGRRLLFSIVA